MTVSDEVQDLSESIKMLRIDYERYFMGLERLAPSKTRDRIKREMRRMIGETGNNTLRRFRLQSLQATLVTYESHWDRISRQIEEGTYKRDRIRAQSILDGDDAPEAPAEAPPERAAAAPASKAKEYPEAIRKLHAAYEQARSQSGDSRAVSIDALAATVTKQIATIKAQYNCKTVEFKVVVKEGKPVLKAFPKN